MNLEQLAKITSYFVPESFLPANKTSRWRAANRRLQRRGRRAALTERAGEEIMPPVSVQGSFSTCFNFLAFKKSVLCYRFYPCAWHGAAFTDPLRVSWCSSDVAGTMPVPLLLTKPGLNSAKR